MCGSTSWWEKAFEHAFNSRVLSDSCFCPQPIISSCHFPSWCFFEFVSSTPFSASIFGLYSLCSRSTQYTLTTVLFSANLMRTGDGNSLSTNNVEFHIQNEDFPALPGANHLDTAHGQISLVCFFFASCFCYLFALFER